MALKDIISLEKRRRLVNSFNEVVNKFAVSSYSQEGEDMILRRIFDKKKNGFYVDVGAFHPTRFSNTYYLYKLGWRGINIDAMPGSMKKFNSKRSRDINLEIPVSSKKQTLKYFAFNEPALNTFSESLAKERNGKDGYKILFEKNIETNTLAEILDKYIPTEIDDIGFFSIDVESLDYDVLISNNWDKYKPKIILIEDLQFDIRNPDKSEIIKFLDSKNYTFFAKTVNTLFFKSNTFKIDE
jgi:hypothetical protein